MTTETKPRKRRSVTLRSVLADLAGQRRFAVAEVQRIMSELKCAREALAEIDAVLNAVRAI